MTECGFNGFNLKMIPGTRDECTEAIRYITECLIDINTKISAINNDKNERLIIDSRRLKRLYGARDSAKKTKLLIESHLSSINMEIKNENRRKSSSEDKILIQIMRELITEEQFIEACARARGEA